MTISFLWVCIQDTVVKGVVKNALTDKEVRGVSVEIEGTEVHTTTGEDGVFLLTGADIPRGEQVLVLRKQGFIKRRFQIVIKNQAVLNMEQLKLKPDINEENREISTISLSDNQLDSDRSSASNLAGLLQSSKDVFLKATAYSFSAAFFRTRGYSQKQGKVLINGIEMNKIYDGDPEYSSFGGLNDLRRNQVYTRGITANDYSFGALNGVNNSVMRASKYREGGRVSFASANRSYRGRVAASYSSGMLENGWAFSVLGSRRYAEEGFREGTVYDANSFMGTVEKKIGENHSVNFTAYFTPNRRGKSTAITEEVYKLKGNDYNPYWGKQNGDKRNSRIKEIEEPVVMLNHYWDVSESTRLNTNVAYQNACISNSRIDNGGTRIVKGPDGNKAYIGGAKNTSPIYYQNLPSYYLKEPSPTAGDYQKAFLAERAFRNNGQIDWAQFYDANENNPGGNSTYILKEDVRREKKLTVNTILSSELTEHINLTSSLKYRHLDTENFANIKDLLGGDGYLDIDNYFEVSEETAGYAGNTAQADLNNPDRIAKEGERFKYNYAINAEVYEAFAQARFKYNNLRFFVGGNFARTSYQRQGYYKNGYYPDNSFGQGEKLNFNDVSVKAGFNYKLTGRHNFKLHAGYLSQAPNIENAYSNPRQNSFPVQDLRSEKIKTLDLSYIYQAPSLKGRLTAYYTGFRDGTDVGFFFTQGLAGLGEGNEDAFVQQITNGINRRNIGLELGFKASITSAISIKTAGAIGQNTYTNNPDLYLTSDDFDGALRFGDGKTKLKDYHVAGGPECAFQLGFEYRSPDYWWLSPTVNYLSNAYIGISNLRRSDNFVLASDGLPIENIDTEQSRKLLRQEQFGDYFLVNLVGGKSWKLGHYYLGFFATINNIFDQAYKTGGFEQSRKANYTNFNEDQSRENGALFGNRYFFGYGTTYYLNFYIRF